MKRMPLAPSALTGGPLPAEREIFVKAPSLLHQERPTGGNEHG